jgi:hypothetical protein
MKWKYMTSITLYLYVLILSISAGWSQETQAIQMGKGHPFICTDYTQGKVFVVSAEGKLEWEYPAPSCNDVWILPNGNFLFNIGGVKEVTREKKVVWSFFDHTNIRTVSSVQLLDIPGDASKGEIWH